MNYDKMPGVRRSDLWAINQSPKHFQYNLNNKKETKALQFGSAAHKYLLEPEDFDSEIAIIPEINRRTKEGKAQWQEFQDECERTGKISITGEDFEIIKTMVEEVRKNSIAMELLNGAHEQSFHWIDDLTGEECKCKVDCLTEYEGQKMIVDYKTTDSCEDGHFERSARKYGYQFQAGMYCEGLFQNTLEEYGFAFIAQEKTEPYAVRVYICSPEWILRGYDKYRELIGIYHECKQTGNWYGYEGPDNMPAMLTEED